ncbi:hypothetical protein ZIOFF_043777 [Zingiber officinale]|uniref:Uncharacterized protein n=1 Tax=Zingiber officinale TaxID=94328 RepID=A0A8J5KZ59_ZINOF|nr:hypothetical protein ZIOFF_043777 [Zingiber officinale]
MSAASLVCFHSLISGAVEHRLMSRVKQKHWNQNCSLKISASLSDQSFQPAAKSLPITSKVETLLDSVKWDSEGLAIAVVRDMDNGGVLMAGFVDKEAVSVTSVSRKPTFYNGPSSTDFINVHDIFLECGHDSIIYLGKSLKPTIYDRLADPEVCNLDFSQNFLISSFCYASWLFWNLSATILQCKVEICLLKNGKHIMDEEEVSSLQSQVIFFFANHFWTSEIYCIFSMTILSKDKGPGIVKLDVN